MFGKLGQLAGLLGQAREMQARFGELQDQLARETVNGVAGGGLVEVTCNGQQQVLSCQVDPSLLKPAEQEVLEELLVAAMNQALERSKQAAAARMAQLTGGMDPSTLQKMMSQLGLG